MLTSARCAGPRRTTVDQAKFSIEEFYDRMDDVMSPSPLDPLRAMQEAITSLEEQVKTRVTSVENGRKYTGPEVAMPDGASIFETTGAWEDFATPSRDLRLLIAIDVVRSFPDRVARRPERYAMPKDKSAAAVKAELDGVLAVGAYLVIYQMATPGIIIAGSILSARALAPVDSAIANWRGFIGARQSWKRLTDLLALLPSQLAPMALRQLSWLPFSFAARGPSRAELIQLPEW